ncbi:YpbS family protein [Paenibacillus hexagrammi]|uniref:YpbS family protein n=1 Tax=Paenibacillus hexagrammi TaxID=2908839 RepID=A0ABY3SQV3_9BACL|nr:YpbS family protein [Paenibacillus sp. YPD9-1]UJF35848.1 YpbS family protein [Paenibacillus sp. YPD9-1]
MSVHEAISKHSTQQHLHLVRFTELDQQREQAIDEAVDLCKRGLPFTVNRINAITEAIIAHAKHGISPLRSYVTEDMVRDYVAKL